jgi:LCP family protein required for cell wall assembly
MEQHKIDFLKEKHSLNVDRRRPFVFFGKIFAAVLIVTAGLGAAFSFNIKTGGDVSLADVPRFSLFDTLRSLLSSDDDALSGAENDRINLLLLGVGGDGHDGAQLTDTIIFTSLRPSDKAVGMMSIPRDLTVPVSNEGWRKINAVNALAEAKEKGSGPVATSQILSSLLDQEVNYYVKVDFDGFAELIDELDGLNIYVEKTFSDYEYPIHGMEDANCGSTTQTDEAGETIEVPFYSCRYETLSFQEGWTQMDGETALKYVRSRHGNNGEASDFARSRRQQNLLIALKEKILDLNTLSHPSRITAILKALEEHIQTNLTIGELLILGREYGNIDRGQIANQVLDTAEDGPLYATSMNGAYVILPKNDDWTPIQNLAANIFSQTTSTDSVAINSQFVPQFIKVEIQNGTTISGLAFQASQLLSAQGFEIVKIGNAEDRSFEHTIIYDLTNGEKADELKNLQKTLEAEVAMSTTGWIFSGEIVPKEITVTDEGYSSKATTDDLDFLIILGENSANLVRR